MRGCGLADKSLATFVGGKAALLQAAATDLRRRALADKSLATFVGGKRLYSRPPRPTCAGAAHKTPSPGSSISNT